MELARVLADIMVAAKACRLATCDESVVLEKLDVGTIDRFQDCELGVDSRTKCLLGEFVPNALR
jgi:hypothetical protein